MVRRLCVKLTLPNKFRSLSEQTPECLIVAAGMGSRLQSLGPSKPLINLNGQPLIGRIMENAVIGGVGGFTVVTGFMGDMVADFVRDQARFLGVPFTIIENPDYEKPNGLSVLAAKEALNGAFLLAMCDHLMDPAIVETMINAPMKKDEVLLGVDYDLENPYVDLDDVTRVRLDDGYIRDIGKGIDAYNAYDTGIFKATPALFDAMQTAGQQDGDFSISGGMMRMAAQNKARGIDVEDRVWIDVDDPAAFAKAAEFLKDMEG